MSMTGVCKIYCTLFAERVQTMSTSHSARRSLPEVTRRGPPGKLFRVVGLRRLVIVPLGGADTLRASEALAILRPHGVLPGSNDFARIWGNAPDGPTVMGRLLDAVNRFRVTHTPPSEPAPAQQHLVAYDHYIYTMGNTSGDPASLYEKVRLVLGVALSDATLRYLVLRRFLMPGHVAQALSQAVSATNIGITATPVRAGLNSLGRVPPGHSRDEIENWLLAGFQPFRSFPY
jgi:hypothetical protein